LAFYRERVRGESPEPAVDGAPREVVKAE